MFESHHLFEKIYEILKNYIDIDFENKGSLSIENESFKYTLLKNRFKNLINRSN
jgi:hypothetical protein